ncbi:metal ABC transporter permease [Pseudoclavibacter caeni]|uniref:Metal ABC transporter permease n=1 Tax=Pseudoclavibacter caeni TaxID=908846 RepID=A0A7C8FV67_9MICO|nr:metal ABC transporter permease [Pseudoclavibacter caeni]KAB1633719.1 metal ABC transporter permease [Pseudoclavibacter caeni]NYJ96255.1 manganese/iron transport system permease protein [Pseudoclavibacter caeni]
MTEVLVGPFLDYAFMQRALIAFVILAVLVAAVGAFVALRDLEFASDGLVHAVFPGLAVGAAWGRDGALLGALVAGALAAVILTLVASRVGRADAPVAVVLTTAFSIGVIIVSAGGYPGQLETLLFGQVFAVRDEQLWAIGAATALAATMMWATRRAQLYRAFDPTGARAGGFPPLKTDLVLNLALAVAVVAGSQVLGNLLVLALLVIPAASARNLGAGVRGMVVLAGAFTLLGGWAGLVTAFQASVVHRVSLSPSGAIVGALIAIHAVSLVVLALRRLGRRDAGKRRGSPAAPGDHAPCDDVPAMPSMRRGVASLHAVDPESGVRR